MPQAGAPSGRAIDDLEYLAQLLVVEVADHAAVVGDGDLPGFLGDHYTDGVGALADADSGTVARAEMAGAAPRLGERQEAAGGDDPLATHDCGAVVQGSMREEDV